MESVIRILLDSGAEIAAKYATGKTALHQAAARGPTDLVLLLLEGLDIVAESDIGYAALCLGANFGHKNVVGLLLEKGSNILLERYRAKALILVAAADRVSTAEKWIDRGISVHAKDEEGWSALHVASYCGQEAVAVLLLERAADITARIVIDKKISIRLRKCTTA